jgi:DNA adenine methylase
MDKKLKLSQNVSKPLKTDKGGNDTPIISERPENGSRDELGAIEIKHKWEINPFTFKKLEQLPLNPAFPYFGGKRRIGGLMWEFFGNDILNYVEPFGGTLSVLLARPYPYWKKGYETVNERNPFIVNFYRAVQHDPEQVAYWADQPTFEVNLHATHQWLVNGLDLAQINEIMINDLNWFDPQIAGLWVWGISQWIGNGWCAIDIDNLENQQELAKQIPHMTDRRGVVSISHKLPLLTSKMGIESIARDYWGNSNLERAALMEYFERLNARLRGVRIICGDWKRVVTPAVTHQIGPTAVFLDPPYITGSHWYNDRKTNVAIEVLEWCKLNWENPKLKIAFCGYKGDLPIPENWRVHRWKAPKGYQNSQNNKGNYRECIWLSPACNQVGDNTQQMSLFDL